ncbi:MAG: CPBP family intramembrane metalloprotease [Lachnospiraceae bacterium]|nr:CPBP family intramembrane metalloprotease [Lachnospiraceae bacterium]
MFSAGGEKRFEKKLLLCFLLGISLAMCLNLLVALLRVDRLFPGYSTEIRPWLFRFPMAAGILLYGVITPVIEELIFRWLFFRKLCTYVRAEAALIASALIFGLYHGNAVQFIYAFIFGLVLGYVYRRFENILSSMLIHSAANIYVYVVYFLPVGDLFNKTAVSLCFIMISGLVSYFIMMYFIKTETKKSSLPEKPFFPGR